MEWMLDRGNRKIEERGSIARDNRFARDEKRGLRSKERRVEKVERVERVSRKSEDGEVGGGEVRDGKVGKRWWKREVGKRK